MKTVITCSIVSIIIIFLAMIPEAVLAQGAVNIPASVGNITKEMINIGLSLLGLSIVVGGILMGFANPLGTKIVVSAVAGAFIILLSAGIIELVRRTAKS